MTPIARRLARLENTAKPTPDCVPPVVRFLPGESREETITRANPCRPFILLPHKCADAATWAAMVANERGLA